MPSQYLRDSEKASMLFLNVKEPPAKRLNWSMMLEALTTWPPAFGTRGSRLRVTSITPSTLTSSNYAKPCLVSHSLGALGVRMPALFPRPQSPGKSEGNSVLGPGERTRPWCQVTFQLRFLTESATTGQEVEGKSVQQRKRGCGGCRTARACMFFELLEGRDGPTHFSAHL